VYCVRLHGRGGQGIVTTAELLAVAAFTEGLFAQAFPTFGSERTGAPVAAFCRLSSWPIRTHEPITEPDALIVADLSLFGQVDVLAGLRRPGCLVVNAAPAATLPVPAPETLVVRIDASEIGRRCVGRPVPGAALLGAFAAATGQIDLPALIYAIQDRFHGAISDGNADAARAAYEMVTRQGAELAHVEAD
jgi:pyruvate ferredoxin oxidoreductase gamma subunit